MTSGELEPSLEQVHDGCARAYRQAAFGLADHLVERPLCLALTGAHRSRRVALLGGHGLGAQYTQLPGVASAARMSVRPGAFIGSPNGIRTRAATLRG